MGHTIATIFLPRSCCQTYSGIISQGGILSFNRTVHWRIEHETPSFSLNKRCPTSFLQHCGRQIHRIWTQSLQSSTESRVYCRRKFTDSEFNELETCLIDAWACFDLLIVDAAIGQWRRRLNASVRGAGHIWAPPIKFQLFCHLSTKSFKIYKNTTSHEVRTEKISQFFLRNC